MTATFQDWKLVFLSPWGTVGLVLALVAAAIALGFSIWGYRMQARWSVRLLLIVLRCLSIGIILLLVLQPALQISNVTRVPNHIVVLLDLSRSMNIREEKKGPSRLEGALSLLRRSVARVSRWRKERTVDFYSFGTTVAPLAPLEGTIQATEPATQIQNALADIRRRYQGKDLAAIVLISDGIDNGHFGTSKLSSASRRFLRRLKTPIHTAWVGDPQIHDLALSEVYVDHFAFVRNVIQIEADLLVNGLQADRLSVHLETKGAIVAQREVKVQPGVSRYRVRFEFVPQQVGQYLYTISTPVLAGEALAENNRRSFLLKVIRDRIRVLQVCGRPSWDERFLRQLLKQDPNIDLISFFILRTPSDLTLVSSNELSLIPFPTEELFEKELGSFDLVLLQNFNYKPYGLGLYLPHLRRFVEKGGGLAMIGGDLSFSSGEYAGTPLAEVLPVTLLPNSSDKGRLISSADFKLHLTERGRAHPILQLGRARGETKQILDTLPALSGVNLVARAAPGAMVLAIHPTLKGTDDQAMPVLATAEAGQGRTMAFTTDSSWYWAFQIIGQGGTRQAYDRFWRNAIRWLIRDPELKYLRIILQDDLVHQGSTIKGIIRAYHPDYSPAQKLPLHYEVIPPKKAKSWRVKGATNEDGELSFELAAEQIGAYRMKVRADFGGRETTEEALVLVTPMGLEERNPQATPVLLKQLAEITDGEYLEQVSQLPDLPLQEPRILHVNWRKDVELWSRWWSLMLCVVILGVEWTMRRRFGYL